MLGGFFFGFDFGLLDDDDDDDDFVAEDLGFDFVDMYSEVAGLFIARLNLCFDLISNETEGPDR